MYLIEHTTPNSRSVTYYTRESLYASFIDAEALEDFEPLSNGEHTYARLEITDETIEHLPIAAINTLVDRFCEHMLTAKGYDTAERDEIKHLHGSVRVSVRLEDDFQKDIPYDYRCRHGYVEVSVADLLDPTRWHSRDQRELETLIARSSVSDEALASLRSEAARQYVRELQTSLADLRNLLPRT